MSSNLKQLSGAKPFIFSGKVAAVVAEGGSLFPWFRGSIGTSGRQNVHRTVTVARARFHKRSLETEGLGALFEDEVDKMHAGL